MLGGEKGSNTYCGFINIGGIPIFRGFRYRVDLGNKISIEVQFLIKYCTDRINAWPQILEFVIIITKSTKLMPNI